MDKRKIIIFVSLFIVKYTINVDRNDQIVFLNNEGYNPN